MYNMCGAKFVFVFLLIGGPVLSETIKQDKHFLLNSRATQTSLYYSGFDTSIGQLNSVTFRASLDAEASTCCVPYGEGWFDIGVIFETDPDYQNDPYSFFNTNYVGAIFYRVIGPIVKYETISDIREISPGQYVWLGDQTISYYEFKFDDITNLLGFSFFNSNDNFKFDLYWDQENNGYHPAIERISDPMTFSLVYEYTPAIENGSAVVPIAPSLWLYGSVLGLILCSIRARLSGGRGGRIPADGLS